MASTNLDHADADAKTYGGVIREDVMNQIWDISNIPLPFTDMISKGTHSNRRVEFTVHELATPATTTPKSLLKRFRFRTRLRQPTLLAT